MAGKPHCDLATLAPEVRATCEQLLAMGARVDTWVANGIGMAAVSGTKGTPAEDHVDALLATPGWGRYSPTVIVWGWHLQAARKGGPGEVRRG